MWLFPEPQAIRRFDSDREHFKIVLWHRLWVFSRFLNLVPSVSRWLNRCVCATTLSRKGYVVRFMLVVLDRRPLRWHEHDWQMPPEGTLINTHQCQSTHSINFSFQAIVCVPKPSCPFEDDQIYLVNTFDLDGCFRRSIPVPNVYQLQKVHIVLAGKVSQST